MREPESYWTRKGPPIPDAADLPAGTFKSDERSWCSLSPGMRREIWRDAVWREAKARQFPDDVIARLRVATISGGLSSLDDYLMLFEREDAARQTVAEDAARLRRADEVQRQAETQIAGREAL